MGGALPSSPTNKVHKGKEKMIEVLSILDNINVELTISDSKYFIDVDIN